VWRYAWASGAHQALLSWNVKAGQAAYGDPQVQEIIAI